jgi:hypothetical protein
MVWPLREGVLGYSMLVALSSYDRVYRSNQGMLPMR